jgi:hypothetical protein
MGEHATQRSTSPRLRLFVVAYVLVLALSACGESSGDAYRRGYTKGYDGAKIDENIAREEGRRTGFKDGYEAARPPSGIAAPKGKLRTFSLVAMVAGMVKVVLSFVVFTLILIFQSSSWPERVAKILATSFAVILVFWMSSGITVGFSRSLNDVLLARGATSPFGKLGTGLLAALLMWTFLWILELFVVGSKGYPYLQTVYVVVSSAVVTVLIPLFLTLEHAPNLFGYRVFDLSGGVVLGGVGWLMQRLLIEAEKLRRRRLARVQPRPRQDDEASAVPVRQKRRLQA